LLKNFESLWIAVGTESTAAVELAQKVASNKKKKAVPKIYYAS
jgi:hypothetical protein